MKNKMAALIIVSMLFTTAAFAGCPVKKLGRGVEGIVTSPLEYWNQYLIASDTQHLVSSLVSTVLAGTAMTVKRLVNGVYDVVTFPVNYPKDAQLLGDASESALDSYYHLHNHNTHRSAK